MLILVIIIYKYIIFFIGISLTLSGSAEKVLIGRANVTLTCTATDAAGASYQLSFTKNIDYNFTLLNQQVESCSVYSPPPPGYSAACGSGTDDSKSTSKNYTLIINKIKTTHLTPWYCSVVGTNTLSNPFILQPRCKLLQF